MLAVSKGKYGVHSSLLAWENPRRESLIRPKKKKKTQHHTLQRREKKIYRTTYNLSSGFCHYPFVYVLLSHVTRCSSEKENGNCISLDINIKRCFLPSGVLILAEGIYSREVLKRGTRSNTKIRSHNYCRDKMVDVVFSF